MDADHNRYLCEFSSMTVGTSKRASVKLTSGRMFVFGETFNILSAGGATEVVLPRHVRLSVGMIKWRWVL